MIGAESANISELPAKIYVEITTACNLACKTCVRNQWDGKETQGQIDKELFKRIVDQIDTIIPKPILFMGGIGEPLCHPDILSLIRYVKEKNITTELITNGQLLNEKVIETLIDKGLDKLWISLDGASAEIYQDIRQGADYQHVINNCFTLQRAKMKLGVSKPELDLAFVAMKRNISELSKLSKLAFQLDAQQILVTNVIPYSPELGSEMLYTQSLTEDIVEEEGWPPRIILPRIDFNEHTWPALYSVFRGGSSIYMHNTPFNKSVHQCSFIEKGHPAVRWDGQVSPCLALLHHYSLFIGARERQMKPFFWGDLKTRKLMDIWNDPDYYSFRKKFIDFSFSPCLQCGGCNKLDSNCEDCFGNFHPTCGACFWAHGFVQCP